MKKELISLRQLMAEQNIDYYIIPTTDFHGSEYVNDYFKCRKFVSGFSGSAGTLVISQDEAFLWADGRYFLQAAAQLKGSGIELMKIGEPGVPMIQEYLESKKRLMFWASTAVWLTPPRAGLMKASRVLTWSGTKIL